MSAIDFDSADSPLVMRLFGPFDMRVQGRPLPQLRSRKGYWLLALLVLRHGRQVERDWLAGTLWPESDQSQAYSSLRRTLTDLRQAMGAEAVRLCSPTPQTLCMDLTGATVDVLEFDAAVSAGDPTALQHVVDLYCGPLLEGCTESWALQERGTREQAHLGTLEALADQALTMRDYDAAIGYLRRTVGCDPLRESAQRSLMEALTADGDVAAAVQVYRELRILLRGELNAEPSPETTALFEQIRSRARRHTEAPPRASVFPASTSPPCRIPRPITELVGRQKEVEEVKTLLANARLMSLTGTGGVGKTRLAIQVAEELREDYADGVFFVELAALMDEALIAQAIAAAIGVQEQAGRSQRESLSEYLRTRHLLLILDNCEHLQVSCARLSERLLGDCPHLRILATSRQSLGLTGEVVWRVPSLSLPDLEHAFPEEKEAVSVLMESEAVRLFVERARQAEPAFKMTAPVMRTIALICHRLGGIPLAIELAAARVNVLSTEQIAARLNDRFRLLTGSQTALPRQRTLQAAVDWSYDLLSEAERRMLQRLSVFAGSWTLEGAEAVCTGEGIEEGAVLDLHFELVDKSLVFVEAGQDAENHYRLLETIREYGTDKLEHSGERTRTQERLFSFCFALTERASTELQGPDQTRWLAKLDRQIDNLRAALEWSRETGHDWEGRLKIAVMLDRFWMVKGYYTEGRKHLMDVLAQPEASARTPLRAKALNWAGALAAQQRDYPAARALYAESQAIQEELGDKQGVASCLNNLGLMACEQGDYTRARPLLEQSLAIDRELGDKGDIAISLGNLGLVVHEQGEYALARAYYEEGLALKRELGDRYGIAILLNNMGTIALDEGDDEAARALYEESLALRQELGDRRGIAMTLDNLGVMAARQGDSEIAHSLLEQSLALKREMGDRGGVGNTLEHLGMTARKAGDHGRAFALLTQGLELLQDVGDTSGTVRALEALAHLAVEQDRWEHAVRLYGSAEALREAIGMPLAPVERQEREEKLSRVRAETVDEVLARLWSEGRGMTMEQAIAYALETKRTV